jgi:hypothetical protein
LRRKRSKKSDVRALPGANQVSELVEERFLNHQNRIQKFSSKPEIYRVAVSG